MKNLGLNKSQEAFLNNYTEGTWTYNPATGLVDVEGDFDCNSEKLEDLKGVRFGKVSGSFKGRDNKLTSLAGAPQEVGGEFDCRDNKLTSLAGAPQEVGRSFNCGNNKLTSLAGAPQEVGGYFSCYDNNLTSLVGAPKKVSGDFYCLNNKLTSLAGAPKKVDGKFDCSRNNLTSLKGAPQEVGGEFDCRGNNLTSLVGAPQELGRGFNCGEFRINEEEWNIKGWLKALNRKRKSKKRKLILTLIPAEGLNKEIARDPARMIMKLKEFWNDEFFKEIKSKLVWPKGYEQEADLVGDLYGVGF